MAPLSFHPHLCPPSVLPSGFNAIGKKRKKAFSCILHSLSSLSSFSFTAFSPTWPSGPALTFTYSCSHFTKPPSAVTHWGPVTLALMPASKDCILRRKKGEKLAAIDIDLRFRSCELFVSSPCIISVRCSVAGWLHQSIFTTCYFLNISILITN